MPVKRAQKGFEENIEESVKEAVQRKGAEGALLGHSISLNLILQTIPSGVFTVDLDRKITYWNKEAEEITGLKAEEAIGRDCLEVFDCKECKKGCGLLNDEIKKPIREKECTIQVDGRERIISMNADVFKDSEGTVIGGLESFIDTTERRKAEEMLRASKARLKSIFQTIPSGVFTVDLDRKITYWNKEAEEITGLKAEEAIGKDCLEAFDCKECKKGCGLLDDEIKKPIHEKECTIQVDGRERTISKNADFLRDFEGNVIGGLESFIDTTERKEVEEKLLFYHEKLRSLASKLSLTEERQRRRIAVEVHDRISQNLAFVKMKLGALRTSSADGGFARIKGQILRFVDETIQSTRALIAELGSPVLYELGFVPAVEWLTQQIENQHNIRLYFEDDGQPKPLNEDLRVLLFQASRELLVNIAKHAQARTARVSITRNGHWVHVDVEDDGIGFDSAEIGSSMDTTGRFGLFSIRVRLEPLGGRLEVDSKTNHGTRVTLIAPLACKGKDVEEAVK